VRKDWNERAGGGVAKVSYRALKTRGKEISARSLILHKQNSNIYLKSSIRYVRKEKETNVQNINGNFSDLRYMCIAVIEYDVYTIVLQRAEWALPRPFWYLLRVHRRASSDRPIASCWKNYQL
jgi:hypothetical protein